MHIVDAEINYAAHSAAVTQQIVIPNAGATALTEMVFDVEPNRFPGAFTLGDVFVGDLPAVAYELVDRRLTIALGERALEPGCEAIIELRFLLTLPPIPAGWAGRSGYFGYTARQINLGRWLPVLAYRREGAWIVHETGAIGEQSVAEVADWQVTLHLTQAPEGALIAAPGDLDRPTVDRERYTLHAARDFAVSISDRFQLQTQVSRGGAAVEIYTLGDTLVNTDRGLMDGADHALEMAVRSLEMFSDLFGAYPQRRLVVVQGDFADGMEFSGIIFVGEAWFRTWNGTPQSYLTLLTVHEVAHQWWYASVGSDQALTPWLDEALATYSELIFFEEIFPGLASWWWQFRVFSFVPDGFLDIQPVSSSVYRFTDIRAYINAVYLRGAQMLRDLRDDLGTEAFFDWLAAYARAGRERVVTPDTLWALLTPSQQALTEETRQRYLGG